MKNTLIVTDRIVTNDSKRRILRNHSIRVENNRIREIKKFSDAQIKSFRGNVLYAHDLTAIPGFVQTHVHLCQTLFRGLADDLELLDWLQLKIFPFENAHSKNSLLASVRLGINELILGGTTTILDMGTLRHQEAIFDELLSSGLRAVAGKCMIDMNDLFPSFKSNTNDELKESLLLAKAFHNEDGGRIKYGFAPRFVLTSSAKLMHEVKEIMKDFPGSIFHTHSSENKNEMKTIQKKYRMNNIEYFNSLNLLDSKSILAHCVHVNSNEIKILKKKNVRVAHCPSANLKLGSGIAPIPKYLKEGISVSLGADGAPCNNNLSIFQEMRLASIIQKPFFGPNAMDAETVFRMATIDGAKALHLDNDIGSLQAGKKADIVFLRIDESKTTLTDKDENVYSNLVYSERGVEVKHVMIDGKWVVKSGKSKIYDQLEIVSNAKKELKKLLARI